MILRFLKISDYILLCFNVLLLFFLVYEEKISLPFWMSPIGRMHPLLLHLPIGFSVLLVAFLFLRKEFEPIVYTNIVQFLLSLAAISAAIVAIMGFLLSKEGGYDQEVLQIHKWLGVFLSFLFYGSYLFFNYLHFSSKSYACLGLLAIIVVTGHFGANITHGENYIFYAFQKKKAAPQFTENSSIFAASIFPILESKCLACHNDQKVKGQLNMSNIQKILKGGKHGGIWKIGDALNSHIIQRANLPIEQKEHMPPKGKPQLTTDEIMLLTAWINEGADVKKAFKTYLANSETKKLALKLTSFTVPKQESKVYTFSAPSESSLKEVNTPFCSVFQFATGSPALQADFFVSKKYDRKALENLSKVKEQLIILNLAKMPIKDEDIPLITNFPNLENLNLNQTEIIGNTFNQLKKCKNLYSVALAGTKITKENLLKLLEIPSLKEVFVWNTTIDDAIVKDLNKRFPKININKGGDDNKNEILKLNPPILVNEDFIIKDNIPITFKHTLKNVKIRYSIDGTKPDSITQLIYEKPFPINNFVKIKAIATKENWYASTMVEYSFFKSKYSPDSAYLVNLPDAKYAGGGAKTLYDLKKGPIDSHSDKSWLGFKDKDFVALFEFKSPTDLNGMTISYLQKMDSFIMTPISVEIWGGNSRNDLKIVHKILPNQAKKMEANANLGINIPISHKSYKFIKIIARSVQKLPAWHPSKGQKGWFFVDEVLFY